MTWNYRIVRQTEDSETFYSLVEVYYDANGNPEGHCTASVTDWDSPEDLRATLDQMKEAFDKPIMEESELS